MFRTVGVFPANRPFTIRISTHFLKLFLFKFVVAHDLHSMVYTVIVLSPDRALTSTLRTCLLEFSATWLVIRHLFESLPMLSTVIVFSSNTVSATRYRTRLLLLSWFSIVITTAHQLNIYNRPALHFPLSKCIR